MEQMHYQCGKKEIKFRLYGKKSHFLFVEGSSNSGIMMIIKHQKDTKGKLIIV